MRRTLAYASCSQIGKLFRVRSLVAHKTMVPREGTGRLLLLAAAVIATALAIAPAARGVEPARLKRYPLMDPRASSPGLPVADPPQKTSTARLPPVEELPPPLAPPTFENQGTDVPRSPLPPVPASGLEALEASVGQAGPCEEATYRGTYVPRSPITRKRNVDRASGASYRGTYVPRSPPLAIPVARGVTLPPRTAQCTTAH